MPDPFQQRSRFVIRPWPGLLLCALLLAATLRAQTRSIPFQRLSTDEGLSQSTVNCILQDRTGFLWLGTQDGLNRYDGYGFRVYKNDPTDPSSLPSNWIDALAEDPSGDLWIGTQGGGLARWRRASDTFERFRHDPQDPASLPGSSVRALHVDRSGTLWVGTFQSGLARLEGGDSFKRFRHDPADPVSLSDDRVRALHGDRAGNLWIGTVGGLNRLHGGWGAFERFRHDEADPASLSDDRVFAILEDSGGIFWVGTQDGLNRIVPGDERDAPPAFERFRHRPGDEASLSDDWVTGLLEDRAGRLWVATDGGLCLLQPSRPSPDFACYRHDDADPLSLSNDRLLAIYQDRGGVLWLGTQGGGANKWNPITWSFVHYRAGRGGLANDNVFAFSEDRQGRLYVGTLGGLDVLEDGRFVHYGHDPADPSSLPGDQVTALYHDRAGTLWVGTVGDGLGRRDGAASGGAPAFRRYRHDPQRPGSLGHNVVSAIFEDREGALWIATHGGGLDRFEGDPPKRAAPGGPSAAATFSHWRHDPERGDSLSDNHLNSLAEGPDGSLWVGTFGSGLNRFDPGRTHFQRLRHDPQRPASLSSDTVYTLHFDAADTLWVGTQVGLNRLQGPGVQDRFRHYFERDGLPSNTIWGIRSDGEGRLWMSTNNGLARFDPETETFKSYNASHGLQANEFNFGAHYRSRSGELFFGGVNGFNAFHPDRIEPNAAVPPVVLTSFTKLNEPVSFGPPLSEVEEIELSYRDDLFTFELAALDYTAPEENRYRYRLEGLSDAWVDLGTRRRVTFTDLAPGRYVLRAQGANNDGVWNEEGASVRITVRPPFWQTWWFRLAGFAALAGALWAAHHRRVDRAKQRQQELAELQRAADREHLIARLEAKNDELERFAYTISHDLKAPLVTIRGFLGFLKRDAAAGDLERLAGDVEHIDAATAKMQVLLEDLLALSRAGRQANPAQEVPFADLAREAVKLVAGEIEGSGAEVAIAPDLPAVVVDRARLVEVLQNLLQNAVKYTGDQAAPRVEIGVRREGGQPVFFVRDNGAGIEPQYQQQVFELFQRLSTDTEGTGVGLALVKRIVELHGGRIWVESEGLGHGSTFCFVLGRGGGPDTPGSAVGEETAAEPVTAA